MNTIYENTNQNASPGSAMREIQLDELETVHGGISTFRLVLGKLWAAVTGGPNGDTGGGNAAVGVRS